MFVVILGGMFLLLFLFGLLGMLFKGNRENEKLVSDVKSVGFSALKYLMVIPAMIIIFIVMGLIVMR